MEQFDFIVIGAGMAGASVAAELSTKARVGVLEMEDRAGTHATGRSAAAYEPNYGPPPVMALARASGAFFINPPAGFSDVPLFEKRGSLVLVPRVDAMSGHDFLGDATGLRRVDEAEIRQILPIIRPGYAAHGFYADDTGDLDVNAIHQGYLRRFRHNGGKLFYSAPAESIYHMAGRWEVTTAQGVLAAPVLINASGAWGDVVARLAGIMPVGLQPKRRSIAVLPLEGHADFMRWPFTVDVHETWYMKPQSGKLLVSPADETPVEPHDAYADDEALAEGIDRFMQATTVDVTRVEHSWAGLRTFAPDRKPVVGFDGSAEGFFWLVGQGGYGIQTAPALARLAAALAGQEKVPDDIAAQGLNLDDIAPQRLRQ
jgi:D-arginine dehydrogenase